MDTAQLFGTEKISRILLRLAPPVMLAQLIQALYNIIDSLFVGRYSDSGLTALSIIYPLQLFMIALAVGTGVGINTIMASKIPPALWYKVSYPGPPDHSGFFRYAASCLRHRSCQSDLPPQNCGHPRTCRRFQACPHPHPP